MKFYAIQNEQGHFFSNFDNYQGRVHAKFNKLKPKIYTDKTKAQNKRKDIEKLCFEKCHVLQVVFKKAV